MARDGDAGGTPPAAALDACWDLVVLPTTLTAKTRARLTALEAAASPDRRVLRLEDYTEEIAHRQYRDLDRLARLINNSTSICCAVAFDPDSRQLIVAVNSGTREEESRTRALRVIDVLRKLSGTADLTEDDDTLLQSLLKVGRKMLEGTTGDQLAQAFR